MIPRAVIVPPPPAVLAQEGHCTGHPDPDLWHSDQDGASPAEAVEEAKRICRGCPVRDICLTYALNVPEPQDHGIWGATTARNRSSIRRRARREAA